MVEGGRGEETSTAVIPGAGLRKVFKFSLSRTPGESYRDREEGGERVEEGVWSRDEGGRRREERVGRRDVVCW